MFFKKELKYDIELYKEGNYISVTAKNKKGVLSRMVCVYKEDDNAIYICDIRMETQYRNKGIGSRMMERLIDYAKNNNIKKITGSLSKVDNEHKERLFHYYKKFGYEIKMLEKPQDLFYAEIEKNL